MTNKKDPNEVCQQILAKYNAYLDEGIQLYTSRKDGKLLITLSKPGNYQRVMVMWEVVSLIPLESVPLILESKSSIIRNLAKIRLDNADTSINDIVITS